MPAEPRVLVIDDNIDLTKIISMLLTSEGFAVKVCNEMEEGLFCLHDWKPQLLLLDVNINGEDTRNFCRKIKAEKKVALKVILMSGDESTLEDTDWYGADDCIAKPFETDLLLHKISRYLIQTV